MAIGLFLLLIAAVFGLVLVGSIVVPALSSGRGGEVRELKKKLVYERANNKIAVTALRAIANGSAQPILEAGIALDEIENNETKELSS